MAIAVLEDLLGSLHGHREFRPSLIVGTLRREHIDSQIGKSADRPPRHVRVSYHAHAVQANANHCSARVVRSSLSIGHSNLGRLICSEAFTVTGSMINLNLALQASCSTRIIFTGFL